MEKASKIREKYYQVPGRLAQSTVLFFSETCVTILPYVFVYLFVWCLFLNASASTSGRM